MQVAVPQVEQPRVEAPRSRADRRQRAVRQPLGVRIHHARANRAQMQRRGASAASLGLPASAMQRAAPAAAPSLRVVPGIRTRVGERAPVAHWVPVAMPRVAVAPAAAPQLVALKHRQVRAIGARAAPRFRAPRASELVIGTAACLLARGARSCLTAIRMARLSIQARAVARRADVIAVGVHSNASTSRHGTIHQRTPHTDLLPSTT